MAGCSSGYRNISVMRRPFLDRGRQYRAYHHFGRDEGIVFLSIRRFSSAVCLTRREWCTFGGYNLTMMVFAHLIYA